MAEAQTTRSDAFIFRCQTCNVKLSARPASVGRTFACPKCRASVTVALPTVELSPSLPEPERDQLEPLAEFIHSASLFAHSPFFNRDKSTDDDLGVRFYQMQIDADAFPGDVLALFSDFVSRFKQELLLRQHTGRPMPFTAGTDLKISKRFAHFYGAMAGMDERFRVPFEMPDGSWEEGQRTREEMRKILFTQIDNFEAATNAFSHHFQNSEQFSIENLKQVLGTGCVRPRSELKAEIVQPEPSVASEQNPGNATCTRCQSPLSPHHRFCGDCGQAIEPRCSNCNGPTLTNDRFCRHCGFKTSSL